MHQPSILISHAIRHSSHLQSPVFLSSPRDLYGLGIWILLLTMKHPCSTNIPTIGWNSHGVPTPITPRGRFSKTQPLLTQYAIMESSNRVVGIGVPSKYLDFPVASFGRAATVTLKRARRVRPQRTKKVRKRWSTGVRRPIAKATAAGATPKEIWVR